ncbi:MAG: molybdopterin-dependent oxidoreductase [Treponema sp.]|jgi:CO/xanthine dehydrogenase Mo-binding subunit|nr:molybdopterin-dependent oxidoreductase [Treponema sp.]
MEAPCFVTDIYLPQMLYALTIRSPVAKGRLTSVECPKLPGSYALIRAQDIPGKNTLENSLMPVLAADELSYIGEPVALLLGPDKNTLENYSRHCKVIAQEEEPFFSPLIEAEATDTGMIAARRDIRIGDPETAFAQAASVVRGSYRSGIQEHWYAEPVGAAAWLDETANGKAAGTSLIVRTATQWPFHVKRSVVQVLGLAASKVLVEPAITGIHVDGKLWYPSLISCHAALGAWITQRPVQLILTRKEDFFFSPKRGETEIIIENALNEKGEITGIAVNTTVNMGAYGINAVEILDHVNLGSLGFYKTKNIRLSSAAVRTNIPPQGPCAGFGLAQGFFARECHISRIADTLNQDPAQWRYDNSAKNGLFPPGITVKDPAPMKLLVDTVIKMSDYRRKWASYELLKKNRKEHWEEKGEGLRGIGIALGCQANGLLYPGVDKGCYSIELILEKDGSLEIKTSMAGSGCADMWANTASKILGMDRKMVRINDGAESVDSGPLTMSRAVTVLTKLVEQACAAISKKRFRNPLPLCVRKTVRPQKNPAWDEFFPPAENVVDHSGFARPGWASAIVEVEIDPVEYLPRIRGVWMGVDGGKILDEDRARKSLKASAVQALGWAYREQIGYINGVIPLEHYENFDIPGPAQIPPINIEFIGNAQDDPKGIGDLPFSCIPAAYVQAVSQAMDYHFESIPLKAQDVWYAGIKKIKEGEPA